MKYRDVKINFEIDGVEFSVISISLEKLTESFPKHSHSRSSYEIHYVPFGYGRTVCNGQEYRIVPGTFYVTGPGIEHEQQSDSINPMTEFCVYIQAKKRQNTGERRQANQIKGKPGLYFLATDFWYGTADERINELMKQIVSELETGTEDSEEVLESLVRLYILMSVRLYRNEKSGDNGTKEKSGMVVKPDTGKLTYLIIEEEFLYNYRDLTLESLSSRIGLGKRQTERLLKSHYGHTFQQMKQEARIAAACGFLKNTEMTVAEIADYLGYSSSEHFSYAFKKIKGLTAMKYRHGDEENT